MGVQVPLVPLKAECRRKEEEGRRLQRAPLLFFLHPWIGKVPVLESIDSEIRLLRSLTIQPMKRAHDVAAACCLAMADVRVRLPLGAFKIRVWESLGIRLLREQKIVGSNPTILTDCGGACVGTGRRLLSAQTQVRFLPPQLFESK